MKTIIKKWITFLFLASMLTIAYVTPAKSQYLPDEYTAGLWHLDKEFGTALDFDSNDYVAVPDSTILEPANITVEAWVKRLGPLGTYKYILNKQYGPGWASYGLYTGSTGGLMFYIGTGSWYHLSPDAGASVWDGNWHHIAGTFDGSYVRLYVDGNEVGSSTPVPSGTSIAYNGAGINIGGPSDKSLGGPYHFGGVIDEVRISNVARTSFDLFAPLTVDSDTVALWHFDESAGQSVYDATGNGNDGQLGYTSGTDDNDPTWIDSTLAIDSSPNKNFGTIYGATWLDGYFGKALYFDGVDDYVEVPDSDSLDVTGPITLEAWIKRMESKYQTILAKWRIGDFQRSYLLALTADNKVRFWLSPDGTWPNRKELTSSTTVGTEWTHIMLTWNGTTMKIFINGVEDLSTQSAEISIFEGTAKLTMGKYEDYTIHPPRYFKGFIDEVRISNVAREPGLPVYIDIKPGSDPNSICLSNQGLLPVAILSTDNFDATQIDPISLELGGVVVSERGGGSKKAPKIAYSIKDVDGDGDLDIMAFFSVPDLVGEGGLTLITTSLELTGTLTNGTPIVGADLVRIVPE